MTTMYQYTAASVADFKNRFSVGQIPTENDLRKLQRACTVLANQRWGLSFSFCQGYDFESGEINLFYPIAGSGHQDIYALFSAAAINVFPQFNHYTQDGNYRFGYVAASAAEAADFAWPTAVSNPVASKRIGSANLGSYVGLAYRDPATYGCGRISLAGFKCTGPVNILLMPRVYPGYRTSQFFMLGPSSKATNDTCTPVINNDAPIFAINGGWLRACDEMLDAAEAMPSWVFNIPRIAGLASGNSAPFNSFVGASAQTPRASILQRWVPLVNLDRPRSLWIAYYSGSITLSTNDTIEASVNDFRFSGSAQTYDRCWYKPNYYRFWEIPLPREAYRTDRSVAGIPLANVRVRLPSSAYNLAAAWIGDRR